MNNQLQNWIGQVTTGHGMMVLAPTLMSLASGAMTWDVGLPLLAAGVVGLVWPENAALPAAARAASVDAAALIEAYRGGLQHPVANGNSAVAIGGNPEPLPPSPTTTGLAMLAASAIALSACTNQTEAERAAEAHVISSALMCMTDSEGNVSAIMTSDAPAETKAAGVAATAAGALVQDPACVGMLNGNAAPPAQ